MRLRGGYIIRCNEVVKDTAGEIIELHCSYDPETLGKNPPDGRKVKGVVHWVSARHGIAAEIRLYDRLFNHPAPDTTKDGSSYADHINPDSMRTLSRCFVEPSLANATAGDGFQFEREGYFCLDQDQVHDKPVFNLTVGLRDSWAKIEKKG